MPTQKDITMNLAFICNYNVLIKILIMEGQQSRTSRSGKGKRVEKGKVNRNDIHQIMLCACIYKYGIVSPTILNRYDASIEKEKKEKSMQNGQMAGSIHMQIQLENQLVSASLASVLGGGVYSQCKEVQKLKQLGTLISKEAVSNPTGKKKKKKKKDIIEIVP